MSKGPSEEPCASAGAMTAAAAASTHATPRASLTQDPGGGRRSATDGAGIPHGTVWLSTLGIMIDSDPRSATASWHTARWKVDPEVDIASSSIRRETWLSSPSIASFV